MKRRTGLITLIIVVHLIKATEGPELGDKGAFEPQCPAATEAHPGDNVILPFQIKPGIDVIKDLTLECMYWDAESKTPEEVFVFRRGTVDLHNQDKRFKGNADLLNKDLSSGNVSLQMTVNYSHSGRYYLFVDYGVEKKTNCSTNLTVRAREQVTVTQPNQKDGDRNSDRHKKDTPSDSDQGTIGGFAIAVIIAAIIIAAIIIAYIVYNVYMKKRREEPGHGREDDVDEALNASAESSV